MFNDIQQQRCSVGKKRQDSIDDIYLHADERQYLKKKKRMLDDDAVDCINNPRTKKFKKSGLPDYDRIQLESDPRFKHLLNLQRKNSDDVDTDFINSCKRWYESPTEDFYHVFDVNKVDNSGKNSLHHAVYWSDVKMIRTLLNVPGIDIAQKDNKGRSALRLAVEANSYDSVVELVGGYYIRAAMNIDEADMLSSLEYAMRNLGDNALQIISFLYAKYVSTFDKKLEMDSVLNLIMAGLDGIPVTQCLEELILQGVNVNSTDDKGKSLLMYAVAMNSYEVAKALIQNHANLYHRDNDKNDIMFYATADSDIYILLDLERLLEFEKAVVIPYLNKSLQ